MTTCKSNLSLSCVFACHEMRWWIDQINLCPRCRYPSKITQTLMHHCHLWCWLKVCLFLRFPSWMSPLCSFVMSLKQSVLDVPNPRENNSIHPRWFVENRVTSNADHIWVYAGIHFNSACVETKFGARCILGSFVFAIVNK